MRVGLFTALFAGILVILLAAVPLLPGDISEPPGGRPPAADSVPHCFSLNFSPFVAYAPFHLRLSPAPLSHTGDRWYIADILLQPGPRFPRGLRQSGQWARAGSDSIDIYISNTPDAIRLPAHGTTLVGRHGYSHYWSWWESVRWQRHVVRAVESSCDSVWPRRPSN